MSINFSAYFKKAFPKYATQYAQIMKVIVSAEMVESGRVLPISGFFYNHKLYLNNNAYFHDHKVLPAAVSMKFTDELRILESIMRAKELMNEFWSAADFYLVEIGEMPLLGNIHKCMDKIIPYTGPSEVPTYVFEDMHSDLILQLKKEKFKHDLLT